uniref:Uncharacterized protein n=1 Tax=Arundo donax TaxID=35708 RepID=A0A0A8YPR0_ARUDO
MKALIRLRPDAKAHTTKNSKCLCKVPESLWMRCLLALMGLLTIFDQLVFCPTLTTRERSSFSMLLTVAYGK